MKSFFRNLSINIRDFFIALKNLNKKKKIIISASVVIIVAAAIIAVCVSQELKEPEYDSKEIADSYALCIAQNNYYDSMQYTIMGKIGTEKYICENYLKNIDSSSVSDDDGGVISDMTDAMQEEFNSRLIVNGFTDFDSFLSWYFETLSTRIETYSGDEYLKQELMISVLKNNFQNYMTAVTNEKISENEDGKCEITVECADETEFTDDQVTLFAENKSEMALSLLYSCSVKEKNIKGLKKYTYNVLENGEKVNTINVYTLKSGSKWFVDTTALVY